MKKRLIFVTLIVAAIASCDRQDRPIAGVSQPLAVQYASSGNVASLPGSANVASVAPKLGGAPDGAAIFGKSCAACHQMNGQGIPGAFPPLDGSPYVLSDNVERMASIMLYGLLGEVSVKGVKFNSAMGALGGQFTDEELAAAATYVRSSWSNKAAAISPDVFASMRKKWGSRGPFNITELGEEQ